MIKRRMFILCLLLTISIISLVGCGPVASPEPGVASLEPGIETVSTEALQPTDIPEEQEEEEKVIVRFGWMEEPDCMYSYYHCADVFTFSDLVMEGFNAFGPDCKPIPRLAKSIEVSEDGLTITIHLQEGVTWNDGEPLDASDVAAFFDWITPLSIADWTPSTMHAESWQFLDEHTFQLTTSVPISCFEKADAVWHWVVPPQIYSDMDEDALWAYSTENPVTANPYTIAEWKRGSHIIFDARPDYWAGKPPIDRIVVQFFANADAMINALLSGEIDSIPNGIAPQFYDQLISSPDLAVIEQPAGRILFLTYNVSNNGKAHPAINDSKVREAIDYAINKQQIIDVSLFGKGMICPMASNCGPIYAPWLDESVEATPYDPEIANQILEEAGYLDTDGDGVRETTDGEPLVFRLFFDMDFPPNESASDLVSSYLEQVGIEIEVTAMEHGTLWASSIYEHDFDLIVRTQRNEIDPGTDDWPYGCWSAEAGGGNVSGFCDPEFDDLLFEILSTVGPDRLDLLHEEQRILASVRPEIYLAGVTALGAYRTDRLELPHDSCPYWMMLASYYSFMNAVVK